MPHEPTTSTPTGATLRANAPLALLGAAAAALGLWGHTLGEPRELAASGFGSGVDTDHDGLEDAFEVILGTSTIDLDTDYDGFSDSEEIARHSDPRDANSYPPSNTLSIGQAAFVAGGEFRLLTLIYVPYAITDWDTIDMRLGLHSQNGTMELLPEIYAPISTLAVLPTAVPGSVGLRLESTVPASIFEGVPWFAFVATITDQPGTTPKSAAATNLAYVAGVLAMIEPTSTSVVAPRNYSTGTGSGPLLSSRPIVVPDEVPAAFASGQICLQSTTEVGFVDGVIELLVDSSSCEPADAYCSPTCEFEAGTTKELVDPLALIGG
jgi:hypothetical protein